MKTNLLSSFGNKALRAAQAGFTMIELLVVIAVIGVLSVAVLSAINPIEQINKGRDTRARSDAAQLINAVDRYFAIKEEYPWNTDNGDTWTTTNVIDGYATQFIFEETGDEFPVADDTSTAISLWEWTDNLVLTSEVKQGFTNRLSSDENVHYYINKAADANATMHVCFYPSSNAFQTEAQEECANSDWPLVACPDTCVGSEGTPGDPSLCMTCLP